MHDTPQANPAAGAPPIDPDSEEVQQLKSAAMPLLFQLREDQKREVRALARIIGLEKGRCMTDFTVNQSISGRGPIEPASRPNLDKGFNPLTMILFCGIMAAGVLFVAYSI
eukprot:gene49479-biopygen34689